MGGQADGLASPPGSRPCSSGWTCPASSTNRYDQPPPSPTSRTPKPQRVEAKRSRAPGRRDGLESLVRAAAGGVAGDEHVVAGRRAQVLELVLVAGQPAGDGAGRLLDALHAGQVLGGGVVAVLAGGEARVMGHDEAGLLPAGPGRLGHEGHLVVDGEAAVVPLEQVRVEPDEAGRALVDDPVAPRHRPAGRAVGDLQAGPAAGDRPGPRPRSRRTAARRHVVVAEREEHRDGLAAARRCRRAASRRAARSSRSAGGA